MMKKQINKLLVWQVVSGGVFLFIVSPLILAVCQYEFSDHLISFQQNLSDIYNVLLPPRNVNIFLLNVAISVMGVVASTIIYRYKKRTTIKEFTTAQFFEIIQKGENEKVEFKSSLRYDYRQIKTDKNLEDVILKSIAGFLNGKGGILIIGVNDYGKILGLANDYWSLKIKTKDGFEQRLMLIISNTFGKDICSKIHVTFHLIEDKEICCILIDRSKRPVYVRDNNQTTFFLRTGNTTNPLSTSETVDYLGSKSE